MPALRPFISVVVPSYDRPHSVLRTLDSLAAQDQPAESFEVILVDDGSLRPLTGLEREYDGRLNLRVLRLHNSGCGPARQAGLMAATGRYVAFTDDDCCPSPNWLRVLVSALQRQSGAAIAGLTVNALPCNTWSETTQYIINSLVRPPGGARSLRFAPTSNLAFPREGLLGIGGLNSAWRNGGGEDRDLCARWLRAGNSILHVPEAVVLHYHPMRLRQFLRLHFCYGKGAWMVHHAVSRLRYEPLGFYFRLLTAPFFLHTPGRAVRISAASLLAQALTFAGWLAEALSRPEDAR